MAARILKLLPRISSCTNKPALCRSLTSLNQFPQQRETEEESGSESHIYKEQLTKKDLVKHLIDNVVYDEDNIIVTCKPYGVKMKEKLLTNYLPQTFNECSLESVLPEFAAKLGLDSVELAACPERLASGVTILTSSESAKQRIENSLKLSKSVAECFHSYLVVTVGHPIYDHLETKFSVRKKNITQSGDDEVCDKWSKSEMKRRDVDVINWRHKVLCSSEFCSLVKVEISKIKSNAFRLFLAVKCLSPVLGDRLFGPRVQNIMGVPLAVQKSQALPDSQKLPDELLEALQLTKEEQSIIPNIVHLQSVTLRQNSNLKYHFSVFPPESFVWTCERLGLNLGELLPEQHSKEFS